ncbi:MAG: helix-turn-helix domain-containing protein [Anaerolineae bacterium]
MGNLTVELTPDDVLKLRFAYSPLLVLAISHHKVFANIERESWYDRWADEAYNALHDVDLPYLQTLASFPHYIPDFMTPTPTRTLNNFEEELALMRNTPTEVIRKNIKVAIRSYGESEMLQQFLIYPREMLECLIEDLRIYWMRTLSHHWRSMTAVLDSDILYRGRQLALEGPQALLNKLHPRLRFEDYRIEYQSCHIAAHPNERHHYQLSGEGLQLVPTIFVTSVMKQFEPEFQPMILYTPRGTGLWYQPPADEPDQSLEIALGTGRAHVLRLLATPASTGEIAHRLQITAGAASQHLSRLGQAGLVEPHRNGKRVYYHLTHRGTQLLALFN